MKTRLIATFVAQALCVAGCLTLGNERAYAEFEVSAGFSIHASSDFYSPLSASGTWVDTGRYGRCWHPASVASDWRPYCHGYWEWTDCGWYWSSDEPWAWACYHYGSWAEDPYYGWVWLPGVEWAPAWVYWRTGGDYIGWAPCGPSGFTIDPAAYVFIQSGHFHDRIRPDTVIVNDRTIINHTTEIRNIQREQRDVDGRDRSVVVNNGPGVASVERATGHKFTPMPVRQAEQPTMRNVPERLRQRSSEPTIRQNAEPNFREPQRQDDRQNAEPNSRQPQRSSGQQERQGTEQNQYYRQTQRPEDRQNAVPSIEQPQRPTREEPRSTPDINQEQQRHYQPDREVPTQRNSAPERTTPQVPSERSVPESRPAERSIPQSSQEVPRGQQQQQREFTPQERSVRPENPGNSSGQPQRSQAPVSPQRNTPAGNQGHDKKDHGQDN